MALTAFAVVLALALDAAVAEPRSSLHPVAWFGRLVAPLDRPWPWPRVVGLAGVVVLPLIAAVASAAFVVLATRAWPPAGIVAAGVVVFLTTSFRLLLTEVTAVTDASERDLTAARERLRSLAGRDATTLSPGQLRSAAIESAAENLADGLVAPLLAFAVGAIVSPPLGAAAAAWVKAVNTMDSMLGYRSKPVGWAAARLDDVVMWIPARVSALLLAVAAFAPGSLGAARRWLDGVPSPNSGWPMGVLAAALSVRLEKPGAYVLNPDGELPSVARARRGVRTVGVAGLLAYFATAAVVVAAEVRLP